MSPLRVLDRALWRLPRRVRRALAAPIIFLIATLDALSGLCEWSVTWRAGMAHVDERPDDEERAA